MCTHFGYESLTGWGTRQTSPFALHSRRLWNTVASWLRYFIFLLKNLRSCGLIELIIDRKGLHNESRKFGAYRKIPVQKRNTG